jgi:hypothetical protein
LSSDLHSIIFELGKSNKLSKIASQASSRSGGSLAESLYCITDLGRAINLILEEETVGAQVKLRLADRYLRTVVAYAEHKLPEKVYEHREDAGPSHVMEAVCFLDERGKFDWADRRLARCALCFSTDYRLSVKAKKLLLSSLINRISIDNSMLSYLMSKEIIPKKEGFEEILWAGRDRYGLHGLSSEKRNLLANLHNLIDADYGDSSLGLIASISCMSNADLLDVFFGASPMFFGDAGAIETKAFEDLAESLVSVRDVPFQSLVKDFVRRVPIGMFDYEEARLKALIRVAEKKGLQSDELLLSAVRRFLSAKMETDTRFRLFRFLYKQTKDRAILEQALRFKSKKIRSWALEEKAQLKAG